MSWLFDTIGFPSGARNICLKLNLCQYRGRETGATSDPVVVDALLTVLRKYNPEANVCLVENDASGLSADNVFQYLGIDCVAKKHNCSVFNVGRGDWVDRLIDGRHFHKVQVPKVVAESDLFITHAKLKTHGITKISCGLKNQFGLLRPKNKMMFHKFLDDAIVDANLAMKPHFSVIDGDICQEGIGGPCFGVPVRLGILVGSKDVVAADAMCSRIMGFNPYLVGHVRKAVAKGIGNIKYEPVYDSNSNQIKNSNFNFSRRLYYPLKFVKRLM